MGERNGRGGRGAVVPRRVVPSVEPCELGPREVEREFRGLLRDGATLRPVGTARHDPLSLLSDGYTPKHKIELFDTTYYVTNPRQNPDIRFLVGYVIQARPPGGGDVIHPRIFYKDLSLVWRSASHFVRSDDENWIGKGDVKPVVQDGEEIVVSAEATTDLPLEIQTALETVNHGVRRVPTDEVAVERILRRGGDDRVEPFADFTEPRRRVQSVRGNRVNGGRPIARFARRNDPASLRFAAGYEPDFARGILERSRSTSRLYGGRLRRYRIASRNRDAQYLFFAGPHQIWLAHPQATTTDITSYGVRSIDVAADEDLCVPGYEYHFMDDSEDPPVLHSQIPEGYAGAYSELDGARADASPWLDRLPVIRQFRRKVLGRRA